MWQQAGIVYWQQEDATIYMSVCIISDKLFTVKCYAIKQVSTKPINQWQVMIRSNS